MKSCRKTIGIAAALLSIAVICVTFFQVTSAKASDKLVIRLAHNQAAGSEIADSIALISDIVAEDASMNMEVQIYPSGVLGTEKDIIEMVKAGILDMAKVSSNTLGQFKEEYSIFAVPYLFNGQQHYYDAMQKSEKVKELFMSTEDEGYIAIGYYANGARNFYLKEDKPCVEPSALKGKKIRSMPNTTSMDMIEAMEKDDTVKVLIIISKPPAKAVRDRISDRLSNFKKPVVTLFLGEKPEYHEENFYHAYTLDEAARLAVGLVRGQDIAEGSVEADSSSFFAAEEKKTIKAIQTAAFTGNPGDGKIISYDLKSALRIRTGETDKDAIN